MGRFRKILLLLAVLCASAARAAENSPVGPDINRIAQPFFEEHCLRCHGPAKTKGNLRLDQLDADLSKPRTFESWRKIVAARAGRRDAAGG